MEKQILTADGVTIWVTVDANNLVTDIHALLSEPMRVFWDLDQRPSFEGDVLQASAEPYSRSIAPGFQEIYGTVPMNVSVARP